MTRLRHIAVCLAGGLVLNTGWCADQGVSQKNPYEPIVTRNIFDLNPPQADNSKVKPEPPSKITPDGIMTIFGGTPQVLFKVDVPAHPPVPASEKSYILSEGQGQDGIEVTHIDVKGGMVTFNNHGVVQELPLVKAPPLTTPTPVVMSPSITPPGHPPIAFNRGGGMAHFGNRSVPNRGPENNGENYGNSENAGGSVGGAGYGANMQSPPAQQPLTPGGTNAHDRGGTRPRAAGRQPRRCNLSAHAIGSGSGRSPGK